MVHQDQSSFYREKVRTFFKASSELFIENALRFSLVAKVKKNVTLKVMNIKSSNRQTKLYADKPQLQ